jgi:hypothetical protein
MAQTRIIDIMNKDIVLDGNYLIVDDGVQAYRICKSEKPYKWNRKFLELCKEAINQI